MSTLPINDVDYRNDSFMHDFEQFLDPIPWLSPAALIGTGQLQSFGSVEINGSSFQKV
jgi:hypothetical protein